MAVAWLLDALTGWLGAALGWLAAGGAVWLMAWRGRGQKAKLDKANEYTDTRKRIDEADIVGDDPDAARRWLSERAKR